MLEKAHEILSQLTVQEKAGLCSGADFWHTKAVERLGVAGIMMSDGPHGLRAQMGESDHLGLNESEPATCFPAACATASSFDRELLFRMGEAIGEEANAMGVSVVLGPGANLKRNPLCGRNFEYFSEDPYLSGEMAAAWIEGIQSRNVGACVKHFAANSQERARFINNSVVDERTLHELYLSAFETAVKEAKPWCVMSSYNKLNGKLTSESGWLLTDILRRQWGFDGLVMTDWGGTDDRVAAVKAGTDLEMPYLGDEHDNEILQAVQAGNLTEKELDASALRVLELMLRGKKKDSTGTTDHHFLAREIAQKSAVLLKNDGKILPLSIGTKVAVIGSFAKEPRYQGAGSSRINPICLDAPLDALEQAGFVTTYAEGYGSEEKQSDPAKIAAAVRAAQENDYAVVFAGLPASCESEGYDRDTMDMPVSHRKLIEAVAEVNPNAIVVLMCGAPVTLPWKDKVKAILLMYLGGEAVGSACADLLSGKATPSGKLAETWPVALEDVASTPWFSKDTFVSEYRETLFVGYRWFDTAKRKVNYPFGHGMTYTEFAVQNVRISANSIAAGKEITVCADVTNIGNHSGGEVLQIYVRKKGSAILRPDKELKGFRKVYLAPGERQSVSIVLGDRAFSYFDTSEKAWRIEAGTYEILIGTSSADIISRFTVVAEGKTIADAVIPKAYQNLSASGTFDVPWEQFKLLFPDGFPNPDRCPRPFTMNSTVGDLKLTWLGRKILGIIEEAAGNGVADEKDDDMNAMAQKGLHEYPLRAIATTKALTVTQIHGLVDLLNGHFIRGIRQLRKGGQ